MPTYQIHVSTNKVGYTIRFEDVSNKARTRILYLTGGILFRETLLDPLLSRFSVIMVIVIHLVPRRQF